MGRISKIEEAVTPASTLASDPPLAIDPELLLPLRVKVEAWLQKLEQLRRAAATPTGMAVTYESVLIRLRRILNTISEFERVPSDEGYKRNVLAELEDVKKWAAIELEGSSNPQYKNNSYVQTRAGLARTLCDMVDEFI